MQSLKKHKKTFLTAMLLIMTIMNTITARGSIPIINRYSAARRAASPHAGIACLDCVLLQL